MSDEKKSKKLQELKTAVDTRWANMSDDDRHLVVGIEDGWIDPSNKDLEKYYKLTGVDIHPIRTWLENLISRLRGFEMIDRLIKFLVTLKWKKERFFTYSWGVDDHTDIHILTEESYNDRHRFGTREEIY